MLTLSLNGNNIPVPKDFSMRLTWRSPFCRFDKIPSSYGLGISFPINEYTRRIFGNPERYAKKRTGNDHKFPGFEVRFSGVLLMSGTLTVDGAPKGSYETSLIDQVGVLGEKEQERDILEIDSFSQPIAWENAIMYHPDTHAYCNFTIANSNFFQDKGVKVDRTVKNVPDPDNPGKVKNVTYTTEVITFCYNKSVQGRVNALNEVGSIKLLPSTIDLTTLIQKDNTYEAGEVSVVTPFFYLNYIIKKALQSNNFHINTNFLATDSQAKRIVIYNNYDITSTQYAQTGEILYWDQQIGTIPEGSEIGSITTYNGGHTSVGRKIYRYIRSYNNPTIKAKNHLPKMKLGDAIISTQNLLNVCFHFLPNNVVNIYSRDQILTGQAIDLESYFLGDWYPGEKKTVALKFVRENDTNDQVFSEEFKDISDRRADIKPAVANYSLLLAVTNPAEGDIRFVTEVGSFYEYKWITNTETNDQKDELFTDVFGWEKMSIGYQNGWYEYGREVVEEIKTSWGSCYGKDLKGDGICSTAIVRQRGNMDSWKSQAQSFDPRLMIQFYETHGGNENINFSFEYEKPTIGILAKYWKFTAPFIANRLAVTGQFDFPVNILRHVIFNICSKFRTREGEWMIDKMSTEIFVDRIGQTEIKGFKVD